MGARTMPRDIRDLMIAAHNAHLLVFDNVSHISGEQSDALCRLSSGSGFATRKLQTDSEEMIFAGARPLILNGITSLARRPDLADRSIVLRLKPMAPEERRTEQELLAAWQKDSPDILGALFDALSSALRHWDTVRLSKLPRLADFMRWASAAEPGLGLPPGSIQLAFDANQSAGRQGAFEDDPIAQVLQRLIANQHDSCWNGTASELLAAMNGSARDDERRLTFWPSTAQLLGNWLRRSVPLLREQGFSITFRQSGTRQILIAASNSLN